MNKLFVILLALALVLPSTFAKNRTNDTHNKSEMGNDTGIFNMTKNHTEEKNKTDDKEKPFEQKNDTSEQKNETMDPTYL